MRRGFTLVEQMITVALIGISGSAVDALAISTERAALAELQRGRARVLLDYHARREAAGLSPEAQVLARLTEALPGAKVQRVADGSVVTLTATWRPPTGPEGRRVLTVFSGVKR